jgi:hypothetical protein
MNTATIATTIPARTVPMPAWAWLPSHAYALHDHQNKANNNVAWTMPAAVCASAMYAVSWVTANTKTRSKNNSNVVTR